MRIMNFVFKCLQTDLNQFFMREKFTSISLTIFLVLNFFNQSLLAQSYGTMNDDRDGKTYKTITIGTQTWMAQNLAYSSGAIKCFAYNNDPTLIQKYGGLYNWENAKNSCPNGWKLPSNEDWLTLTNYLGDEFKPKLMKTGAWRSDEPTSNSSGFSGIPAGMVDNTGTFRNLGVGSYFWSSTFSHQSFAFARELGQNAGNYASHAFGSNVNIGMSVRCLKTDDEQSDNYDELDDEYKEDAYQEPQKQSYPANYPITKGTTTYIVMKTKSCDETQDFYYNYSGEYKCKPIKAESIRIAIDIHLNDPMYDEALITMTNSKTKEVDKFEIEHIEEGENGELLFNFMIVNQPHQFILNKKNKTICWYSEWGHWQIFYYYN